MSVRLGLVGAGLIGRRHAEAIRASSRAELAWIADPSDAGAEVASLHGVAHVASLDDGLRSGADGIILATPNALHMEGARACIAARLPVLIEKPLATDTQEARAVLDAAEAAGVAVATGHHRRHNALVAKAQEIIGRGTLGQIATVHASTWLMKPDDYFGVEWRRRKGAGPILTNLTHDIDLMIHLVGPITEVTAWTSNAVRGNEVEETAVILIAFENGALGTMNVSDTVSSPWSWELTARENPAYPATGEDCYRIAGTHGALALPNLSLWRHEDRRSWWDPILATRFPYDLTDPLIRQIDQFADVIATGARPLVSGRDGLAALLAVDAVRRSAETGQPQRVER